MMEHQVKKTDERSGENPSKVSPRPFYKEPWVVVGCVAVFSIAMIFTFTCLQQIRKKYLTSKNMDQYNVVNESNSDPPNGQEVIAIKICT